MCCNTYQYVSSVFGMHCGMYCVVYLVSIQYVLNTNKLYANTDWYVLNTYYLLILNS